MVENEIMQLGVLSVFISYAVVIFEPIQQLARLLADLISCQANIERITDLLAQKPDVTDREDVKEKYGDNFYPKKENWEKIKGDITFEDVSFRYPDGKEYVLEHFNLHIPAGTNVDIIGETGAGKSTLVNLVGRLSAGEKQFISFAKAILGNPSIFVLDEATSSIDTVTEQLIQNTTETLLKGHTSFVIAHRLSTIKNADLILVVKDGKIIERGTHKELLAQEGYYQTLYYKQFEEESVLF